MSLLVTEVESNSSILSVYVEAFDGLGKAVVYIQAPDGGKTTVEATLDIRKAPNWFSFWLGVT